jgi:hypothetical protein
MHTKEIGSSYFLKIPKKILMGPVPFQYAKRQKSFEHSLVIGCFLFPIITLKIDG